MQKLTPLLAQNTICVAFLKKTSITKNRNWKIVAQEMMYLWSTFVETAANVIIISGDFQSLVALTTVLHTAEFVRKPYIGKVWIAPPQWDFTGEIRSEGFCTKTFQGALSFSTSQNAVPGFKDFLQNLKPDKPLTRFLCVFLQRAFECCLQRRLKDCEPCTGEEKLENLPSTRFEMEMSDQSYRIYNAIYAVAHALHAVDVSRQRIMGGRGKSKHLSIEPWQVRPHGNEYLPATITREIT